jgi:hypothetical protein
LLNITEAALVTRDQRFALTTSNGLYKFPLASGLGSKLRPAPAGTVTSYQSEYLVGAGLRVERVPATADAESATWPGITVDDSVRAIKADDRGNIWALTASSLYALKTDADSFAVVGRVPLPSGARRLDVNGSTLGVALGDSGARFLDVTEPAQPRTITDWRGTAFVYDIAVSNGVAYVASGIDGLAKITIGATPRLDGLARELGFIVGVTAKGDNLWVLDRSGSAVVRRVSMADMK